MDVVLEVFDTFVFDPIYAAALPVTPKSGFPSFQNNASFSGFPQQASTHLTNGWQYDPATKLLRMEPGASAYLSSWPRDNVYRQALSLYLITA